MGVSSLEVTCKMSLGTRCGHRKIEHHKELWPPLLSSRGRVSVGVPSLLPIESRLSRVEVVV